MTGQRRTNVVAPAPAGDRGQRGTLYSANFFREGAAIRFRFDVLLALVTIPLLSAATDSRPVVAVTGGQVRGTLLASGAVFQGIPYARPPVGDLRWRGPAPVEPWTTVRDAATAGPPCAQNPYFVPDAKETSREDCLYLNVWTPAWPAKSIHKPVMVWIPGGGNFAGSASSTARSGEKLSRHGVVVVSLNYRLGLFGFFSHPELTKESPHHASGNQGILDQIAALHWVHDNIVKFGGDPENVTIFGDSAGSLDVSALMTSPLSRGLFRRAIGQSGAVVLAGEPLSLPDAEKRGLSLAATWNAGADTSLPALRALPANAILAKEPDFLKKPQPNLGLVIDGYVFPQRPADVFAAGHEHRVDMLNGNVAHEWVPGVDPPADLKQAITDAYPADTAKRALSLYTASGTDALYGTPGEQWVEDIGFRCPTEAQAVWHAAAGNRVFQYQFDRIPPNAKQRHNLHAIDVNYVFGLGSGDFEPVDYAISDALQQYWTNFAKTGDPNGTAKLPKWPQFGPASRSYIEFTDAGPVVRKDLRRQFCELWSESRKQTR
ncbi:MAG: carboxylesterase family protein [Acidobacteriaceae bacterium]